MEVDIMASVIKQNFAFGANNSSYNISNAVWIPTIELKI